MRMVAYAFRNCTDTSAPLPDMMAAASASDCGSFCVLWASVTSFANLRGQTSNNASGLQAPRQLAAFLCVPYPTHGSKTLKPFAAVDLVTRPWQLDGKLGKHGI